MSAILCAIELIKYLTSTTKEVKISDKNKQWFRVMMRPFQVQKMEINYKKEIKMMLNDY